MAHDLPITKQDLDHLRTELAQSITSEVANAEERMIKRIDDMEQKILHQFGVIKEDLRANLIGAHKDKIMVLVDHDKDYGERIS